MRSDQFPTGSMEWMALAKLEAAAYEAELAQEMAAYRPECLRNREEQP